MVKLIIELKENNLKKIVGATIVDCDIEEVQIAPTESEQKSTKILKEKLGIGKKVQFIKENKKSDTFEEIDKIVNDFFKSLDKTFNK